MNKEELYNWIKERQPNIGKYIYSTICEAYYVGWRLIGNMLENGWSFSDIARIKEDDMVDTLLKYCRIL